MLGAWCPYPIFQADISRRHDDSFMHTKLRPIRGLWSRESAKSMMRSITGDVTADCRLFGPDMRAAVFGVADSRARIIHPHRFRLAQKRSPHIGAVVSSGCR